MTEQPPPANPYGSPPPPPPAGSTRPGELLDRFLARLIDGIGYVVVYIILLVIFTAIFVSGSRSDGEAFVLSLFLTLVSTAAYLGYYVYFESSRGATIGKRLMKLKVVGPDGVSNPTTEQALRRNAFQALGLLGIIPFVGFFLGPIASLAAVIYIAVGINSDTVHRQGWHDKFAGGTRVLKVG